MRLTVETAPTDQPILVWVADAQVSSREAEGWKMGRCVSYHDGRKRLLANGFNGDWNIPYWHPLPDTPETEK